MQRMPFRNDVEFRGVTRQASEFKARDTGQMVNAPARLQFEHRDDAGTLTTIDLGASSFDRLTPPVDWASFAIGQKMVLAGVCVMPEKGSDKDPYISLVMCDLEAGKGSLKAA